MLLDHSSDKAASYCVEHDLASKAYHNIKLPEAVTGQAVRVQQVTSYCLCGSNALCSASSKTYSWYMSCATMLQYRARHT